MANSTFNTLPSDFVAAMDVSLCRALIETEPVVSLRLNAKKTFAHPYTDRVPWWDGGFYLDERPSFTLDPAFASGAYYVQEASSMFVGWLINHLDLDSKPTVLDLCAAPGGKSTLISSIIGHHGVLVANEVIRSRASVLAQNVQKWGDGNTIVTSVDASAFGAIGSMFDLLVVDVPCSGEGMFRKDQSARAEWSTDGVEQCAARGRRIVADAWASLREGGYLIYSTCTFNEHENERNAQWIAAELGGEIVDLDTSELALAGLHRNAVAGYNFYPHLVRGEGFYAVLVRKTAPSVGESNYKSSKPATGSRGAKGMSARPQLDDRYTSQAMLYTIQGESFRAYSEELSAMVDRLRTSRIFMLSAGVDLGVEIRGWLKPSHELALYHGLREGLFPRTELPLEAIREYMRKGVVDAALLEDGLNMICYQGQRLGFAKRIGARVNNLYPTAWRVLK